MAEKNLHFLFATYPAQGHINPALQLAKRLIRMGAQVTFTTSVYAHRRMLTNSTPLSNGFAFAPFSDGYDHGYKPAGIIDDDTHFMTEFKRRGTKHLTNLVLHLSKVGRPVSCLIYTLLLPWAAQVATHLNIPSTLLWIQPATVFDIYHYCFDGYSDLIVANKDNDPSYLIDLPGLPSLTCHDLPSFLCSPSSNPYAFAHGLFKQQFEALEREREKNKAPLRVLVNTFDALEPEALKAVGKMNLIGIGPLIPSAFLDSEHPSDTSFGGDLFNGSKEDNYIEWLNSKKASSVVYVSFGTVSMLEKKQMEELRRALVESGRPFLWVIRENDKGEGEQEKKKEIVVNQGEEGLIVSWCSQVEVLSHPAVGCFMTHCGWNSSLESVVAGVPVVAFPLWTDQATNAKLIKDIWKTGVRVKVNEKQKIVESEELKKCLQIVMGEGEEGQQMRMNARKWKELARKAVEGGGSSDRNLRSFVEEVGRH